MTTTTATPAPTIRAPHGTTLRCKGWQQEAALRCLMNNLDPEVGEAPEKLVVYGGIGKAARNWDCYHAIVRELERLGNEETLLVQSGKPVGVFPTHDQAPRVLIANSNLVGAWANWDELPGQWRSYRYAGNFAGNISDVFRDGGPALWRIAGGQADRLGRHWRHGRRAAAGSHDEWRGVSRHRRGPNANRAEIGESVLRPHDGFAGRSTPPLRRREAQKQALSVCLVGNCAEVLPELVRRHVEIDAVTDQTSAHDPLNGYVPAGYSLEAAAELRQADPVKYVQLSMASMAVHVEAMLAMQRSGAVAFDYGNNIRKRAFDAGCKDAFDIPGFTPEYIRPLFCEGAGPFRWVALSGDPADIYRTDDLALELFPENEILTRWIHLARARVHFQGLPARICWLGLGERARMGEAMNDLVRKGELKAPIAIGRDHLDTGSVASPYRETEQMKDGSDAIADWPILNALLNTASGASWVSFHHGGGVGMGYSLHAGQVSVADGTKSAQERLHRVLNNDPGIGVARHVDAGYEKAIETANAKGVQIPMRRA